MPHVHTRLQGRDVCRSSDTSHACSGRDGAVSGVSGENKGRRVSSDDNIGLSEVSPPND